MKLLRGASRLEVKRAFVTADLVRQPGANRRYLPRLSRTAYLARLRRAQKRVAKFPEARLDKVIGSYEKRLRSYNTAEWHLGKVSVGEIGVWRGAGGLPVAWTNGSLKRTAIFVARGLKKKDKHIRARSRRAIPAIIEHQDVILHEPSLALIIFQSGTGTDGRRGVRRMKGDIDDGNMRAIALAVGGAKTLPAYIGLLKKKAGQK